MIAKSGLRLVMTCLALRGAAFAQMADPLAESKFAKAGSKQAGPNCSAIQGGPNGYILRLP